MNPWMYWNSYKTHAERKNRIVFFIVWGFYKTFESDAMFMSYLFGFQVQVQWGMKSIWFPVNSWDKYFNMLKQWDFSFIVLQITDSWVNTINYYIWNKSLEINIPVDIYMWFIEEIKNVVQKYENSMRMLQTIDIPFINEWKDIILPELPKDKEYKTNIDSNISNNQPLL